MVHNHYQSSAPSGEDVVFKNEKELLKKNDIEVITYERSNDDIKGINKLKAPFELVWSRKSYNEIKDIIRKEKPDIAHFHNIFYLISPSAYYACRDSDVPVVQTLHNFRLFCVNGLLLRNGEVCKRCVGGSPWNGSWYGCFRDSRIFSVPLSTFVSIHNKLGTFKNYVESYISLSNFNKNVYIEGGLPKEKIFVKPNFLPDPPPEPIFSKSNYLVFIGRLSKEKGASILLDAFTIINKEYPDIHLKILGSGSEQDRLQEKIKKYHLKNIDFVGRKNFYEVLESLKNSMLMIMPSIWYECFPMTIREAYACGKPVIASNLGSLAEIVKDGKNGLLFEPGNAEDLAEKIRWMVNNPDACIEMGKNARKEFEEKYTEERNFKMLMEIYGKVLGDRF